MRAESFARCRPLTEAGSGLKPLSSDALPLVDAANSGNIPQTVRRFSGMKQAAGALRVAAMRLILPVMFTREAIGNGRTVGGDTPVEFEVIRSRNPQRRGLSGTYLAQQLMEGA
jgi:hypothetical protein